MARSTPPAWLSVGILLVIVAFCCGISDVTDGLLLEATGRRTPGALVTAAVLALPVIMLWRLLRALVRQAECDFGEAGRKKFHPEWTLATVQSVLRAAALPVLAHLVVSLNDTLTTYGWPTGDPSHPGLPRVIGLYVVLIFGLSVCCFPRWLGAACSVLPASVGYWLAWLVGVGWTGPDPRSGSVIIVACNRRLSEAEAASLLARVPLADGHPFAWLATAVVAANRGDIAAARLRFGLVAGLPVTPGCEPGRRLAREWLCTEALARGAWGEATESEH